MRSLIAVLVLSTAIIGGGIYCTRQTDKLTYELTKRTEEISEEVENGGFKKAAELLGEINDIIESNSLLLASYIDHGELNKINLYLTQLEVYLDREEKDASLVCGKTLNRLFVSLPEDYKVKLENVF